MIKVLLADDHGVVRKGLRFLLEQHKQFQIVGQASDGREAVKLAGELVPEVVVMDIVMPLLNGIEAASQIVHANPKISIVILSMHADETYLTRALSAGVRGYLLKDSADDNIVKAVETVAAGKPFFSPSIAQTLLDDYMRSLQQRGLTDSYDLLTSREKEVLLLLAEGKSNKEAAWILNVSPYTVETHRTNFMQKLNLHNTAEIVLYAVRKKIIS